MRSALIVVFALLAATCRAQTPDDGGSNPDSVKIVAPERLAVSGRAGSGVAPLYLSADWSKPLPDITRAVLVFHGILRNADLYYESGREALQAAGDAGKGTLLIAPQFLGPQDVAAFSLGKEMLAWKGADWTGGDNAVSPAPLSSFEVIDAVLAKLADRALFPALKNVVVAGHSGGGQVVQRYAVVGKGEAVLSKVGVGVRYVVANPSSYLYFSPERPNAQGEAVPFADAAACPKFDNWKFGFAAGLPPYVDDKPAAYEARYVARDVVYLLGNKDIDPNHASLDKTCMGRAEGPYRFARGHFYAAIEKKRNGAAFKHRLYDIDGVGHEGGKMFGSACGLFALFDKPGCGAN